MMVYLASPGSLQEAEKLEGLPVLLSFTNWTERLELAQTAFKRLMIDSGAYSEISWGITVDGAEYKDWYQQWLPHADSIAGLDDIRGDWKKSLKNYEKYGGFPTIHNTDPIEILPDLVEISRKQGKKWLGIGIKPPRGGKEAFVRRVCEEVPEDIHIHGFALPAYSYIRRIDSVDTAGWRKEALAVQKQLNFLTYAECVEIIVKRMTRWQRILREGRVLKGFDLESEPSAAFKEFKKGIVIKKKEAPSAEG